MEQEAERLSIFRPDSFSDLDSSFTSSTTSASTLSARSSLSLPSFSSTTSSYFTLNPLPHNQSDPRWSALRAAANISPDGLLHLQHFRLLRHLGTGHLARVFHCRLHGFGDDHHAPADFALKVIDLDALSRSDNSKPAVSHDDDEIGEGKMWHVRAEAEALNAMDHPFLPTLYARLDASHYACFLIDYCPGGDLHSLLRRRRGHRLPPAAARFYAAEVLLALEYLHALGFVYRDLKPENVLLRADGHVMLSDFDLSFRSDVTPILQRHRHLTSRRQSRLRCCLGGGGVEAEDWELEFVAEPSWAFSKACVGTHEYLAPEVVGGAGHGSGVDWWAFGVFLYEMLYGRTPFKGATKDATLRNILMQEVKFLEGNDLEGSEGREMARARDLISRLLVRDPAARMGSAQGAAEIKRHPFFEGVRWPLIRCARPPVVPGLNGGVLGRTVNEGRGRPWWSGGMKSTGAMNNDEKNKGSKLGLGIGQNVCVGLGCKKKVQKETNGRGRR